MFCKAIIKSEHKQGSFKVKKQINLKIKVSINKNAVIIKKLLYRKNLRG